MKTYEVWVGCNEACKNPRPRRCIHATRDQAAAEKMAEAARDEKHSAEVQEVGTPNGSRAY